MKKLIIFAAAIIALTSCRGSGCSSIKLGHCTDTLSADSVDTCQVDSCLD